MRKAIAAVLAMLLVIAGWWYVSPVWTLRGIRDAARQHDAAKLSKFVDYSALRDDLKTKLPRYISSEAARVSDNEGAIFAPIIAAAILKPVLDEAASPGAIQAMFGAENRDRNGLRLAPVTAGANPVIERDGLNTFRVHGEDRAKGALVFHRYGLGWKLAGIDLPTA